MGKKYKKCPIPGCGGSPEAVLDTAMLACDRCNFCCNFDAWNKLTRYDDIEWAGATHKALLESSDKWLKKAQRYLKALKYVNDRAQRGQRALLKEASERYAAEKEASAYLGKLEALQEKLREIIYSRRCTDHGCIWGHPGGMGTNGGCQSKKYDKYEAMRELAKVAKELRATLGKWE